MDVIDAMDTRLELREYSDESIDDETLRTILAAGRQASSGKNLQHWRFVVVRDEDVMAELADRSPTGGWIDGADVAVAMCTDPDLPYHDIDAGRAVTHMQLAAWAVGVGSCIYTVEQAAVDELLGIPEDYHLSLVVGFGYPVEEVRGHKNRAPLAEIAFADRFGEPLELD